MKILTFYFHGYKNWAIPQFNISGNIRVEYPLFKWFLELNTF